MKNTFNAQHSMRAGENFFLQNLQNGKSASREEREAGEGRDFSTRIIPNFHELTISTKLRRIQHHPVNLAKKNSLP
ncbi:MAG TPA: hypothetical protein VGO57_01705 [Verrucomicrobiae bacterium]|jgi:hypothetical protein